MDDARKKQMKAMFKDVNRGIEVKAGENFASLSKERRDQYFRDHENYWKKRYNAARGTVGGQQNFSRG
jgi:shikimate kinase